MKFEDALKNYADAGLVLANAFVDTVTDQLAEALIEVGETVEISGLQIVNDTPHYEDAVHQMAEAVQSTLDQHPELVEAMKRHPSWVEQIHSDAEQRALYAVIRAALPIATERFKKSFFTREVVESCVLRDYEKLAGRVISISFMEYADENGRGSVISCDPPILGRVLPLTSNEEKKTDILRWMDDKHIDPIYNVELVEPYPALPNVTAGWLYGQSWAVGEGRQEAVDFELCPEHVQLEYPPKNDNDHEIPEDATFRP